MELNLRARIRKLAEAFDAEVTGGDPRDGTLTPQLELLVAQGAGANEQINASGRSFWIGNTAAVAAVVATPTTAVLLALYNTAPDGGRSLVIDWVAAQNVVSTAVASQAQMIGNIGQTKAALPAANSALIPKKRNGYGPTYDTVAWSIINGTALDGVTGLAANWFPIGQNGVKPGVAATPGYGMYQRLDGDIIVPPGRYFALHVQANVVGETFVGFIGWHEKQMALQ